MLWHTLYRNPRSATGLGSPQFSPDTLLEIPPKQQVYSTPEWTYQQIGMISVNNNATVQQKDISINKLYCEPKQKWTMNKLQWKALNLFSSKYKLKHKQQTLI